jgi:4-amino-4-deoxy-L-arabinose transferase-like glycosyltransferase
MYSAVGGKTLQLILILVIAALLRLPAIGRKSINPDEMWTLDQGRKGWTYATDGWREDAHPPLRYLPYHYWLKLGEDDWLRRLPAAAGTVGTVYLVFLLAQALVSTRVGLVSALLFAVSPFSVFYSDYATMYFALPLLAVASLLCMHQILMKRRTMWYVLYVVVSSIGTYGHYYFFLILLAENAAFLLLYFTGRKRSSLAAWIAAQAVIAVAFAPWLPMFVHHYLAGSDVRLAGPLGDAHRGLKPLYFFYAFSLGHSVKPQNIAIVIPAAIAFFLPFAAGAKRMMGIKPPQVIVSTFFWIPLLTASLRAVTVPKHLYIIYPAYCVLLAVGILSFRRAWVRFTLGTALVIVSSYSLTNYYGNRQLDDVSIGAPWKELAAQVQAQVTSDDLVVVLPEKAADFFNFYYTGDAPVYLLNSASNELKHDLEELPTFRELWAVLHYGYGPEGERDRESVKQALARRYRHLMAQDYVKDEHLLEWAKNPSTPPSEYHLLELHHYAAR